VPIKRKGEATRYPAKRKGKGFVTLSKKKVLIFTKDQRTGAKGRARSWCRREKALSRKKEKKIMKSCPLKKKKDSISFHCKAIGAEEKGPLLL